MERRLAKVITHTHKDTNICPSVGRHFSLNGAPGDGALDAPEHYPQEDSPPSVDTTTQTSMYEIQFWEKLTSIKQPTGPGDTCTPPETCSVIPIDSRCNTGAREMVFLSPPRKVRGNDDNTLFLFHVCACFVCRPVPSFVKHCLLQNCKAECGPDYAYYAVERGHQ